MQENLLSSLKMKIKYQVEITTVATKDIKEIWKYIQQDNQSAADHFIHQLVEQIESLSVHPERCAAIPENEILKTQYKHLIYKQYRTIFKINKNTVYILRIIHGAKLLEI